MSLSLSLSAGHAQPAAAQRQTSRRTEAQRKHSKGVALFVYGREVQVQLLRTFFFIVCCVLSCVTDLLASLVFGPRFDSFDR